MVIYIAGGQTNLAVWVALFWRSSAAEEDLKMRSSNGGYGWITFERSLNFLTQKTIGAKIII